MLPREMIGLRVALTQRRCARQREGGSGDVSFRFRPDLHQPPFPELAREMEHLAVTILRLPRACSGLPHRLRGCRPKRKIPAMLFGSKTDETTRLLTQPMQVLEKGVYHGPHYYSHTPMVRIMLDIGRMEDWPSNRIPGFADALIEMLPGLDRHGCSLKKRGGFIQRLRDGTWIGHVVEHVAIELQTMAGHRVTRGKTRSVKGKPGVYNVMFAYREDEVGLLAGRTALELVNSLLPAELQGVERLDRIYEITGEFDLDQRMEALKRLVRRTSYGPTTQSLIDEAKRRGIPVMRLGEGSLVQLGHGKYQQRIRASISGKTSQLAVDAA
ncbi:MAG TPA: hypothetical protein VEY69_08975, partial [Lautropia sp.]|nr:hypothetical protein [Lautropia sp.]